jgi:hypothetical protein
MITKRTKIMLGVLVLVAIGAYAYLYWWSRTPDHGVFDTVPFVRDASDSASDAVIRPQPAKPAAVTPGTAVPTEGTPTVPSTTYKTFENSEFSFSFAYPDNWSVSQNQLNGDTHVCVRTEGGTGDCLISVLLQKQSVNVSAERSLEALKAEFRAGKITESTRRIGGEEAQVLKVSGYPSGEEESTRAAVFMKNDIVYVLTTANGQEAMFDRAADSFLFRM